MEHKYKNFFNELDKDWGETISDTYEETANNEYIIQINGIDYNDVERDIKIKTNIKILELQAQHIINYSHINLDVDKYGRDFTILSKLVVAFDESTEIYLNNKNVSGIFNGVYINFVPSRYKDKDKYIANIDFISADLSIQDNINFLYIPYMKSKSCTLQFSNEFKNTVFNAFLNDPYYDSNTRISKDEIKDEIDKELYAIKKILNI